MPRWSVSGETSCTKIASRKREKWANQKNPTEMEGSTCLGKVFTSQRIVKPSSCSVATSHSLTHIPPRKPGTSFAYSPHLLTSSNLLSLYFTWLVIWQLFSSCSSPKPASFPFSCVFIIFIDKEKRENEAECFHCASSCKRIFPLSWSPRMGKEHNFHRPGKLIRCRVWRRKDDEKFHSRQKKKVNLYQKWMSRGSRRRKRWFTNIATRFPSAAAPLGMKDAFTVVLWIMHEGLCFWIFHVKACGIMNHGMGKERNKGEKEEEKRTRWAKASGWWIF